MSVRKLVTVLLLFFAFCTLSIADNQNCVLGTKYVYIISSNSATLAKKDGASSDDYTLTMHDLKKDVLWLKGRPCVGNCSGKKNLSTILALWNVGKGSFAETPPNALVVYKKFSLFHLFSGKQVHEFVLTNPRYDAEANTLTFDAKALQAGDIAEGKYYNVSVFLGD